MVLLLRGSKGDNYAIGATQMTKKPSNNGPNAGGNEFYGSDSIVKDKNQEGGMKPRDLYKIARRRYKWILISGGATFLLLTFNAVYQRATNPIYQGKFTLLIDDPISTTPSRQGDKAYTALALNNSRNVDVDSLVRVMRSPLVLGKLAKEFRTNVGALSNRISIKPIGKKSNILHVSLRASDPIEGKLLIDKLAVTYLNTAKEQKDVSITQGLSFLDTQAPALRKQSSALLHDLEVFRKKHNVIDAKVEADQIAARLNSLKTDLKGLEANRITLLRVRQQVENGQLSAGDFSGSVSSGRVESSGSISGGLSLGGVEPGLIAQINKLESSLANARSIYRADSAQIKRLEEQKKQLKPMIVASQQQAVDTALLINTDQIESTNNEIATLTSQFNQKLPLLNEYQEITTKLKLTEDNLKSLQSAKEAFGFEMAQQSAPWRLMSPAFMGSQPIGPSISKGIGQGAIFALLVGCVVGFIRDKFDHVFHSPDEVKEDLNIPLLGHIPHVSLFKGVREDKRFILNEIDSQRSSSINSYEAFFYQEAFRNLYTSIRFLNAESPVKTLALTSSLPSEGKSLVNVLLAKTLSEMGKKVLLIDADLRKPQMHIRLGLNNIVGLSNILTDTNTKWQNVLQDVSGHANWKVITAGQRPPDPAKLLSSDHMANLISEIGSSDQFDLILFDTPPVLGLADSALIASNCDGLILLVSLNRVDRSLPTDAAARIKESGAPLVGVVTNAILENTQSSKAYGYGNYGYGYGQRGYGYGAYNTANVYSYYQNDGEKDTAKKKSNKPQEVYKKLLSRTHKLTKWMDA